MMTENERLRQKTQKYIEMFEPAKTKLANRLGISGNTLFCWLNGKMDLCDKTLERIDKYYAQFDAVL